MSLSLFCYLANCIVHQHYDAVFQAYFESPVEPCTRSWFVDVYVYICGDVGNNNVGSGSSSKGSSGNAVRGGAGGNGGNNNGNNANGGNNNSGNNSGNGGIARGNNGNGGGGGGAVGGESTTDCLECWYVVQSALTATTTI